MGRQRLRTAELSGPGDKSSCPCHEPGGRPGPNDERKREQAARWADAEGFEHAPGKEGAWEQPSYILCIKPNTKVSRHFSRRSTIFKIQVNLT